MSFPDPDSQIRQTSPVPMLREALRLLRHARKLCRLAKAPKAYDRCRAAVASTEGALRHAEIQAGKEEASGR